MQVTFHIVYIVIFHIYIYIYTARVPSVHVDYKNNSATYVRISYLYDLTMISHRNIWKYYKNDNNSIVESLLSGDVIYARVLVHKTIYIYVQYYDTAITLSACNSMCLDSMRFIHKRQ